MHILCNRQLLFFFFFRRDQSVFVTWVKIWIQYRNVCLSFVNADRNFVANRPLYWYMSLFVRINNAVEWLTVWNCWQVSLSCKVCWDITNFKCVLRELSIIPCRKFRCQVAFHRMNKSSACSCDRHSKMCPELRKMWQNRDRDWLSHTQGIKSRVLNAVIEMWLMLEEDKLFH